MPLDLNSELKNRLKKSTHATVSNLKKSLSICDNTTKNLCSNHSPVKFSPESEDDKNVFPQKNLAKILRSVSKENMYKQNAFNLEAVHPSTSQQTNFLQQQHGDTISLVRNLSSLDIKTVVESASEGESSGGREVSEIIKKCSVGKCQTINDGIDIDSKHLKETLRPANNHQLIERASTLSSLQNNRNNISRNGIRRSSSQAMGPDQKNISQTSSIADRLAALQKSGEDNWRKRLSKREELEETRKGNLVDDTIPIDSSPELILTHLEGGNVSERLGKLKNSSEKWKSRVEQTDASKFTLAGRQQTKTNDTPVKIQFDRFQNTKKSPPKTTIFSKNQPPFFLSKSSSLLINYKSNFYPKTETVSSSLKRSSSVSESDAWTSSKQQNNKIQTSAVNSTLKVVVPKLDEDGSFKTFFSTIKNNDFDDSFEISDFDVVKSNQRLVNKKVVQGPKGRRSVKNPLKSLAARNDIQMEYTEIRTTLSEKEINRTKSESVANANKLAAEAIAGLASIEDYKSVNLKSSSLPLVQMWLPYKSIMLLHIKGRTHVQTRLIEPNYNCINRGDCFILITKSKLYRYVGLFANVIEISRSKKICAAIIENKDLGCTASSEIILTDGEPPSEHHWNDFWTILQKPVGFQIPDCGHADEDDLFENSLIDTNIVYEFLNDSLVPYEKYWGCIPKVEMLHADKIIVFDFGSEMYVWSGKNATFDAKRRAMWLAQEHFDFDKIEYDECYVNPINYSLIVGNRNNNNNLNLSDKRGDWCLLGKINQHMETSLFKEKFADWPEIEREDLQKDYTFNETSTINSLDGVALFKGTNYKEPNLVLENSNLGRGSFFYDPDTMRHFDVITISIVKWKINEFNFNETDNYSHAHFYSAETYIIRWAYRISVCVRELTGNLSTRSTVGRDRCVYFYWQGSDATANEKGAAALLTIDLASEKGVQMRVTEGEEIPAFVRLFKLMFRHKGRQADCKTRRNKWRMYILIGIDEFEMLIREVQCSSKQLRSRGSVLIINGLTGEIYIWHGCKSLSHSRRVIKMAAQQIQKNKNDHLFLNNVEIVTILEIEEGEESQEFISIFGELNRSHYSSLISNSNKDFNYSPRLFHFFSTHGVFEATEILHNLRTKTFSSPFPFTQTQLYSTRQPTTFMIDDGDQLWLWMGWWPLEDVQNHLQERNIESPTNENRAGVNRWISEKRAALKTAVSYWTAKYGANPSEIFNGIKGFVVWAGLESLQFISLFPDWQVHEIAKEINIQDGRTTEPVLISEILTQLTQTEYPLSIIMQRPLPEGVDPTRLEVYLNDTEFDNALGICRKEFEQLPLWKQTSLKKEKGLF